jgi:predicted ABC-class ATPase
MSDLTRRLERLDRRQYGGYRELRGQRVEVGGVVLGFDHIQGDPFASPSRLEVQTACDR